VLVKREIGGCATSCHNLGMEGNLCLTRRPGCNESLCASDMELCGSRARETLGHWSIRRMVVLDMRPTHTTAALKFAFIVRRLPAQHPLPLSSVSVIWVLNAFYILAQSLRIPGAVEGWRLRTTGERFRCGPRSSSSPRPQSEMKWVSLALRSLLNDEATSCCRRRVGLDSGGFVQ
jgi:hypothetical protein